MICERQHLSDHRNESVLRYMYLYHKIQRNQDDAPFISTILIHQLDGQDRTDGNFVVVVQNQEYLFVRRPALLHRNDDCRMMTTMGEREGDFVINETFVFACWR